MREDPPADGRDLASGRFAKGRSGNPKGRPRRAPSVDEAMLEAVNQKAAVRQDGRQVRLTKAQLSAQQIANSGARGDLRAAKLALELAQKSEARLAAVPAAPDVLGPGDREIAERFVERLRRQAILDYVEGEA